jgi:PAS domain S-box-containing protein
VTTPGSTPPEDPAYDRAACGLLTTARDGTIQRVNTTFCAWTGHSAAELLGRRFQELLTIGSKLFHQTHWMPLLQMQGSVAEVQLEIVHRDGRVLAVLVNAARRRVPDGTTADGTVDIAVFIATDRRKYERELLAARRRAEELLASEREAQAARVLAEARLRLALESAQLRVWSADLPGGVRRYERDVAALLGAPELAEVDAAAYVACIHPDDRATEAQAFAVAVDPAERASYSVEYRLLGRDGVERIVRSTGRAFFGGDGVASQFSGVLEDVTSHRRAHEALRQREIEFRALAENSPDIITRIDRQHRYLYMSPSAEPLAGRPVAAMLGKRVDEVTLGPEVGAQWIAAIDDAFRGRDGTVSFCHHGADGVRRDLQARFVAERDTTDEVRSVLAITRDVTALRRQERDAEQRALLAEQLIGIVSHDLRNPLNAVLLGTHLLGANDPEVQRRTRARITSAAQRATRLVNDLLDFTQAKLGGGIRVAPREVQLHTLVGDCLDEVRLAWPGRALEHRRIGDGVALADPDRLAQVVTNLGNNALTYGAPEVPVTFTTMLDEHRVEIHVHNGGPPIPRELQATIFEPMKRGEDKLRLGSRSVGLGLYIVGEIAAAHGGRVRVRSEEGEGTTFIVSIPRDSAGARVP